MTTHAYPYRPLVEKYKGWWLARYTPAEIHVLAQGLWGDVPNTHGFCARRECGRRFERGLRQGEKRYCSDKCRKRANAHRAVAA